MCQMTSTHSIALPASRKEQAANPHTVFFGASSNTFKSSPRTPHAHVRSVQLGIQCVKQTRVHFQFVVDLQRDVVLTTDRGRELV